MGTNWVVTTLAGLAGVEGSADGTNSDARFAGPHAISVDNAGAIYVADSFNNTLRKLTRIGSDWVVTTAGGTPGAHGYADGIGTAARFFFPQGIVVDDSGSLFVADVGNNTIRIGRPPPALRIAGAGDKLILSWPSWANDFLPESATALSPDALWTPVTGERQASDSAISWAAKNEEGRVFFRLRKP